MGSKFDALVSTITQAGLEHHAQTIVENSRRNASCITSTIRDIPRNHEPAIVISAGPSLYRNGILGRLERHCRRNPICVVATDGAYIQCLKAGIKPDWVITIDPHPTRIVRWFGDPEWERNSEGDDYFARQDLDIAFRQSAQQTNQENIRLVDGSKARLVISTTAPANVVQRTNAHERFWFAPLVDDPEAPGSITAQMCDATACPALNTGGTVGTAAWVFASQMLGSRSIAVVGMDYGYPTDTPLKNTQEWNLTGGDPDLYPQFPERGYYSSPTYFWYRQNFLDLLEAADARVTNCSGAGLLYGDRVDEMELETWLKDF
jgi:hypothetical protein